MPANDAVSTPLLDFVLSHARIQTNLCTFQRSETGYTLPPRTVPDYNFIYVTRGRVVWVIDGTDYVLNPGGLVIVPPAVPHNGFSQTKRMTLGSLHVDVTLPGGRDAFELLSPPRFQNVERSSRLDNYLRGFMAEFGRGDEAATRLMLPGWARLIVLELFRHDAEAGVLRPHHVDPLVSEILDELHRRLARDVSLRELARWSGFSAQHLNRLFRRVLGVTPLQYLTRLRIDRAAALLAEGTLTVAAVGRSVGIPDAYYFSRLFRQHTGRSPAEHRAAAGSDSPSPGSAAPFTPRRRRA